jgi:hypothetical protein
LTRTPASRPDAIAADTRARGVHLTGVEMAIARQARSGAGNRAIGRILARDGDGTTTAPIVHHKTGAEVDAWLLASDFFKKYIKPKYDKGIKAEGHVHIDDDPTWEVEIVKYLKGKQNPDTGGVFDEDTAKAWGKNVNAFADGREIHANEHRGEAATTVHESMHLFSDDRWLNAVGFNANEGATEYFTKKLCAENHLTRGNFYAKQYASVKKLADKVGEKALADAFYDAKISELKDKVDGTEGFWGTIAGWFKKSKWKQWVAAMQAAKYDDADKLL